LAGDAGAATAGAAAKVEEAAQKSADPAQAAKQIASNTGFSDALQALLASGDIESLIMMVMSERADRLTEGVQSKFTAMDANNKKLKALNDQAAVLNGKVAKDSKDQTSAESLGKVNAEITQLSNTMQKEQIELNSLMSKLTQTYEALSNLMKKLADTQSSLIRNILARRLRLKALIEFWRRYDGRQCFEALEGIGERAGKRGRGERRS